MSREILVYADWEGLGGPQLMGLLRTDEVRGEEVYSFEYESEWLESDPPPDLDPDLKLFGGSQYNASNDRPNFGIFLDSSPDRWGRVIMQRREAMLARREKREVRRLIDSDYLLGVHDEQRMGALRFKLDGGGKFLDDRSECAAPPWNTLRELEQASWNFQDEGRGADDEEAEWLNLLIAPGSSLGGARPKAGVREPAGDLWIAKFPGRADEHDVGGWEWVTWQLAGRAGLKVGEAKVIEVGRSSHRTFAAKRFDRVGGAGRLHFASAMTLLGYGDGAGHAAGVSYLELVELISNHGVDIEADLEELWRRIVFSICVSNTDDHLRNHGFLLSDRGWRLSPAYDLNPNPQGRGLSLNIDEGSNALHLDLAREVAPFFSVEDARVEQIIDQVRSAVSGWREEAEVAGLPRAQIELLEGAFRAGSA